MPRRCQAEKVVGRYLIWLLDRRNGVWYADGRSGNAGNAGRHSLGTRDADEARQRLTELDAVVAARLGLAPPPPPVVVTAAALSLDEGHRLYIEHAGRSRVAGGVRDSSKKRYRAVLDKFTLFAKGRGLATWNQVTAAVLEAYLDHLQREKYAYRTQYLEGTCLKQVVGWLVRAGHLPDGTRVELPLRKAEGTDTYCWRPEEVRSILDHCLSDESLHWLGDVVVALAATGLRISELATLRWSDVDLESEFVHLKDESSSRRAGDARTTKGGRGRSFPIHPDLLRVLERLPRHPDGRIFHGPLGGRLKPDTVRRVLVADVLTLLSAKFPTPEGVTGFVDGRLHSFRHYFVTQCVRDKVPERTTMRWLGHRDSKMVNHYYHLCDDESRRMMRRLDVLGDRSTGNVAGPVS